MNFSKGILGDLPKSRQLEVVKTAVFENEMIDIRVIRRNGRQLLKMLYAFFNRNDRKMCKTVYVYTLLDEEMSSLMFLNTTNRYYVSNIVGASKSLLNNLYTGSGYSSNRKHHHYTDAFRILKGGEYLNFSC